MVSEGWQARIARIGGGVLRWSLVLFFVGFGLLKFTAQEAAGVAPLMSHSPFLFWAEELFGQQGASDFIGVIEITLGLLVATRHVRPAWSGWGSLGIAGALLVTLSFLFTTPGVLDPGSSDGGFLAKDLTLLGAALSSAAEAFAAARQQRGRSAVRVASAV